MAKIIYILFCTTCLGSGHQILINKSGKHCHIPEIPAMELNPVNCNLIITIHI
jgi:hypothetical protein